MTHVFISYSHSDTEYLKQIVDYLTNNNIAIWYDANLEGGDDWRDEITIAIDEAFAMLIVISENAMHSHYCTYEWSYGMGTGMPIIPLIFEDINITEIHAPLRNKQFVDCTVRIPDIIKTRLDSFQQEPIDVIYLRRKITEAIMPFRIYMHTLAWYRSLPLSTSQTKRTSQDLGMVTRDYSVKLYFDILPELITIRSHAFTSKLRRHVRSLTEAIHEIHDALQVAVFDAQIQHSEQQRLLRKIDVEYQEKLEPIIVLATERSELFDTYIEYLNTSNQKRPNPFHKMDVRILLGVYLNDKEQEQILTLIDNVLDYLYPRN